MYKAVVFDLYGTLLDIHTDENSDNLWEKTAHFFKIQGADYEPDELRKLYSELVNKMMTKKSNRGVSHPDIDVLKVFKKIYKLKGIKASGGKLKETARFFRITSLDYVKPYPQAVELLEMIHSQKVKIILLSNAQEAFTLDELNATGIREYFQSLYISSNHKVAKPDPAFFQLMLSHEKLDAKDCLMIGNDHTTDIMGADAVGMDALYFHTNCSRQDVPDQIPAKWRVDSGKISDVINLLLTSEALGSNI